MNVANVIAELEKAPKNAVVYLREDELFIVPVEEVTVTDDTVVIE